jgi:hypothetical protein
VANSEGYLDIRRNIIGDFEENYPGPCRVYIVSRFKDGHQMTLRCAEKTDVEWVTINLRLDRRGRLHADIEEEGDCLAIEGHEAVNGVPVCDIPLPRPRPKSANHPDEHWRCGPYHITIVPGPDYQDDEDFKYIVLEDFIVLKNGRDAGHFIHRAKMNTEPDGHRWAYWSGSTRGNKYNGAGELITRNGVTTYTEVLLSGKFDERLLKSTKHFCKRIAALALVRAIRKS